MHVLRCDLSLCSSFMSAVLLVRPIHQLYCSLLVGMSHVQTSMAMKGWIQFLCVHAGVSGNGRRQDCVAPPTAAAPHIRGHPPGDMGYGIYYCTVCVWCMCMCMCIYIRCDVGAICV